MVGSRNKCLNLISVGGFQDGMLKYKGTYEIISPDDIGLTRVNNSGIVLGKLRYHANVAPITRLHIEYLYSMINPSLFMEEISTNFLFLYYLYKSSRSSRVTEVECIWHVYSID